MGQPAAGDERHRDPDHRRDDRDEEAEVRGVEGAARPGGGRGHRVRGRARADPELHRERCARAAPPQGSGEVQVARGRAADLPARGLRHRARRHQGHDVGRHAERRRRPLGDEARNRARAPGLPGARLRDDDQALRAELGTATPNAATQPRRMPGTVRRHLLDLLRHEVAAGLDDEVLAPPGDEDLALGEVGEVAAVEPAARPRDGGRGLGLAVVARRSPRARGRPPCPRVRSATAPARVVDDAHLVLGQRPPHGHEPQQRGAPSPSAGPRGACARRPRARCGQPRARVPAGGRHRPTAFSARP